LEPYCALTDLHSFPTRRSSDLIGTTTVYHELRDGEGNLLDSCSFTVTVNDAYCNSTFDFYTEPISYVEFAGIENTTSAELSTPRSEEHTSELQSRENLVCRLLL